VVGGIIANRCVVDKDEREQARNSGERQQHRTRKFFEVWTTAGNNTGSDSGQGIRGNLKKAPVIGVDQRMQDIEEEM
jgi:hypothetical protein